MQLGKSRLQVVALESKYSNIMLFISYCSILHMSKIHLCTSFAIITKSSRKPSKLIFNGLRKVILSCFPICFCPQQPRKVRESRKSQRHL